MYTTIDVILERRCWGTSVSFRRGSSHTRGDIKLYTLTTRLGHDRFIFQVKSTLSVNPLSTTLIGW